MRFVIDPRDGRNIVTPDITGKLPGRGAWVLASKDALDKAVTKGGFARSFKKKAVALDDLGVNVEAGLERQALSALGLARRAGAAAAGFDQVAGLLKSGDAAALICATDGAPGGKQKLKALMAGVQSGDNEAQASAAPAFIEMFDSEALSAAVGREGVVHVAIRQSPSGSRFLREIKRLAGFREGLYAARPPAQPVRGDAES